jgi:hypothetical protein
MASLLLSFVLCVLRTGRSEKQREMREGVVEGNFQRAGVGTSFKRNDGMAHSLSYKEKW